MRLRTWLLTVVIAAAALGGLAVAALLAWPEPALRPADAALARVVLSGFAGRVEAVTVVAPDGTHIPVALRQGRIWPLRKVAAGERLRLTVSVRRPGWAGWLVGRDVQRTLTVVTPTATLRGSWLQVASGAPVEVSFDAPVSVVAFGRGQAQGLAKPSAVVPTGLVASGSHSAGEIEVAAAPRLWESLSKPALVRWFPALPDPQVLADPSPGATLSPGGKLTLTFSRPVVDVLGGAAHPELSPATPGRWQTLDAHTLRFTPLDGGFSLGAEIQVGLSRGVILAGDADGGLVRTLHWQVPVGSTLRLQQLLAQLGYLPLRWQPGAAPPRTARAQLLAAISAPQGHFTWRYPNTPPELQVLWTPGQPNEITRGAVMRFEQNSNLAVDGIAGPQVWKQLIADAVDGSGRQSGYSYVYVHRNVPQSLNLWVNGHTILSSPGNTGVPSAPTQLGTYPVFEHIPIGTMSGTNPDGSHYHDTGIQWISYFHGGDAIHSFNRASYGTPQSLGCVELPLSAAAEVWPHTPIGTLVTIEN